MSGFDIEWAQRHQAKSGKPLVVAAGVGSREVDTAMAEADPFAAVTGVTPEAMGAPPAAGITLVLPYPISANRYWRPVNLGKHISIVPTKEAKAYQADVQRRALLAGVRKPIMGRVTIDVQLYPHRPLDWAKRAAKLGEAWDDSVQCIDLDNANKVLMDSLRGVAIEDDKWVRRLNSERMEPDAHGARVVVTIKPIARVDPRGSLF